MSATPASPTGALELAFERFETAAAHLRSSHASLVGKVESLERRLLDANRRLETLLDTLDSGVAVVTGDGVLLRENRAFARLAIERSGERLRAPALLSLLGGRRDERRSTRLRVDGPCGTLDVVATVVPVEDEDGTWVLTAQDVTAIRREEEEGGRRLRLEALGRMAAELAHEVRNPLGSIRLFAAMLHEDLRDRDEQRRMAEQVLRAAAGLETTVSNLLAFAAPPRGEPRTIDLAALAREVTALFEPVCAARGVALEGPRDDASCPVDADPEALRQVLLNLLGNALAATGSGGTIRLSAAPDGARARLAVTDDGCGIAAEDLPRVFDPFFTRREGGTGLGLSIVHGIVERHGGSITLESRPGRGTRARVELPRSVAAAREVSHG